MTGRRKSCNHSSEGICFRTVLKDRIAILQTAGVVRFVAIGARLSWIPDAQIESVPTVAGRPDLIKRESYLSSGERVKVISGPIQGVEGINIRMKGSTCVVVSLDSIAQSVSVEVQPESLEKSRIGVEGKGVLSRVLL